MNEQNELLTAAMQIILYTGNVRSAVDGALEETERFNFQEAASRLQKAEEAITLAHKSQTDIIQKEAGEYGCKPSLLSVHVQDILMTIRPGPRLNGQLIDVLKIIKNNK